MKNFNFDALLQAIVDFFALLKEFLNKLKGIEVKPEENF